MQKKIKPQEIHKCDNCDKTLSPTEVRVWKEGVYAIDPDGDDRKLCELCKREVKNGK